MKRQFSTQRPLFHQVGGKSGWWILLDVRAAVRCRHAEFLSGDAISHAIHRAFRCHAPGWPIPGSWSRLRQRHSHVHPEDARHTKSTDHCSRHQTSGLCYEEWKSVMFAKRGGRRSSRCLNACVRDPMGAKSCCVSKECWCKGRRHTSASVLAAWEGRP